VKMVYGDGKKFLTSRRTANSLHRRKKNAKEGTGSKKETNANKGSIGKLERMPETKRVFLGKNLSERWD